MTRDSQNRYGVIMGDLIGSSTASVSFLHKQFNSAIQRQNNRSQIDIVSPLTITLGDEFQGIVTSSTAAAKIARQLRHDLLTSDVECRFVIGQVEIETPINRSEAWNMMGVGLAKAREKLNQKRANQFYRFSILKNPVIEQLLDAVGMGLSVIERSWTDQQREDISSLIEGRTPSDIARDRQVSIHSIYKVRGAGEFDAYTMQWEAIETSLTAIDQADGDRP